MSPEQIIKQVKNIIQKHLPEKDFRIFLFGSWAKNRARPTSDVDIAIFGKKPIDDLILIKIKEEIEDVKTLRTIEVVDLHQADERFKKKVLSYAKVL